MPHRYVLLQKWDKVYGKLPSIFFAKRVKNKILEQIKDYSE